jgi:hypothetical protein
MREGYYAAIRMASHFCAQNAQKWGTWQSGKTSPADWLGFLF